MEQGDGRIQDDRKALEEGTKLCLDKHRYTIQEEVGRGAGCICYGAFYLDSAGLPHDVRIKECFPYGMGIVREGNGRLLIPEEMRFQERQNLKRRNLEGQSLEGWNLEERSLEGRNMKGEKLEGQNLEEQNLERQKHPFVVAKEKFWMAYQNNVELKRTLGMINSTIDVMDIFAGNNTWYAVTGCMEGVDYRKEIDSCAQHVLIRMGALAKVIQKYHAKGILHLDIKPENILVIPETMEHVVLFDFDSLVLQEEIRDSHLQEEIQDSYSQEELQKSPLHTCLSVAQKLRFSCSEGFSAPELMQGDWRKICPATDVYSIGAMVFQKLFGRTPRACDGAMGAAYDFRAMGYQDVRYPPEFFSKLTEFFHKAIASSVRNRYQDMGEVAEALQELAALADVGQVFLCANFSYHFTDFVGRDREIEEIYGQLQENQVVFLSGIGGIGKTETARRLADEYREEYRNVLFVPYQDSLLETVCSEEIQIHNFARGRGEAEQDFFARKLAVLKQVASREDLVILDNFDTEEDVHLEDLLACPCRFLITTREDFRDYHYAQVELFEMGRQEELLELFQIYNWKEYGGEEQAAVQDILEFVEGHTMTVELIAKYLRDREEAPSALLSKLMEKEGLTGTGETRIRHRKDKRLRAESVSRHLQALFDLSGFAGGEEELIKSLSLLGAVRIKKEAFLELCDLKWKERDLANLIRRGFVQYRQEDGKVSLHQIILDMVYCQLKPTSGDCVHMVEAMEQYVRKKCIGGVEQNIRDKLLANFLQRLRGDDLHYVSLAVAYGERFPGKKGVRGYVEEAERICRRSQEREAKDYLQKIYVVKMALAFRGEEGLGEGVLEKGIAGDERREGTLMRHRCERSKETVLPDGERGEGAFGEELPDSDREEGTFGKELPGDEGGEGEETEDLVRVAQKVISLAETAFGYAKLFSEEPEYLGEFCYQCARKVERGLENCYAYDGMWVEGDGRVEGLDLLLSCAESFYQRAENYLVGSDLDAKRKQEIFEGIQEFYLDSDFNAMYRGAYFADAQKAYHFQELINELRKETQKKGVIYFRANDMSYLELARAASEKGDDQAAALYYEKEAESDSYYTEEAWRAAAEAYLRLGEKDKAAKALRRLLPQSSIYDSDVCERLVFILALDGKVEEAKRCAAEFMEYNWNTCQSLRKSNEKKNYSVIDMAGTELKSLQEESGYACPQ